MFKPKMIQFLFIIIIILLYPIIQLIPNVQAEENVWTALSPMQKSRGGLGVAVVNDKIYALGGYTGGGPYLDTNEEYDPTTDTWTTKAPIPTAMAFFGVAVYQNKIYCISSENGANQVYDPETNTWETKASLPNPEEGLKANAVADKIYVVGGSSKKLNVYNIETDSWTTKAEIIKNPDLNWGWRCASVVVEGKIHVIGAFPAEFSHQIYDPISDEWSVGEPCLRGWWWASAGVTSGVNSPVRLFVFGANDRWWPSGIVRFAGQFYDPIAKNWTSTSYPPTGRLDAGVAVLNDEVYVIGGWVPFIGDNWFPSAVNEKFTPFLFGSSPQISITSPENILYNQTSIPLEYSVNETTSWIGYSLDGQTNVTLTENTNLTGLVEGTHTLEVFARDMVGDEGVTTITFTVDTLPPVITVLSPENKTYSDSNILLNVEFNEQVLDMKYSLDGLENQTFTENMPLAELEIGGHNVTVYATDLAGHTGTSENIYFAIEPLPTTLIIIALAIVAVVGLGIFVYFKKYK